MTITIISSLLTLLATCGGGDTPPTRNGSSTTERAAVLRHLAQAREQLGRMSIRYSFPLPAYESRGGYIRQTYWFDNDTGLAFDSSHGETSIHSDDWTERQKTIVVADGWLAHWPNKRTYAWSREASPTVPIDIRHSPVFQALGLWPLRGRYACAEIDGSPFDLETVVADSRYELTAGPGGRLLIERRNMDRCVLDSSRGYALLERTWFDSDGDETMKVSVSSLRGIGNGLWLPEEFHLDTTTKNQNAGTTRRLTGRLEVAEHDGRSGFDFTPPPGAMLLNHESAALTQVVPGGESYIEDQAEWVRDHCLRRRSTTGSTWTSNAWLWGLAAFGVCLFAGRVLYREKL